MQNIIETIKDTIEYILRTIKTKLGIKEEVVLMDKMTGELRVYDKISGRYEFYNLDGTDHYVNLRHLKNYSVIELLSEHHTFLGRL